MIVACRGQRLDLLPERAIHWIDAETLLVADAHFGKASVFRAGGIPIPPGTTKANLARVDALLASTRARRILFLGDFLHGAVADNADFVDALKTWRAANPRLDIRLLVGNHDRFGAPLARDLDMRCVPELLEGPFVFRHHPESDPRGYVLCGHVHPAIDLADRDGSNLRARVFWFRKSVGILPSFGEFTGSAFIEPAAGDSVYAVGPADVVPILRGPPL